MAASALSVLKTNTIARRRFKASAWTAGHLRHTIEVLKQKHPNAELQIMQTSYHTGFEPSKGTHDFDGVFDVRIEGMTWLQAQRFLRGQGWAAWHRKPPAFDHHIHMATIPPGLSGRPNAKQVGAAYKKLGIKVGKFIDGGITSQGRVVGSSQIVDYFAHAPGLSGQHSPGSDKTWFPADISKTIYQPEDDMTKKELLQVLNSKEGQAAIAKAVVQNRLGGQTDKPAGGRTVGHSLTIIYNRLLEIEKKLNA